MLDFSDFFDFVETCHLRRFAADFNRSIDARYRNRIHGDHADWQSAFDALPALAADTVTLDSPAITAARDTSPSNAERARLEAALMGLHPWRKGPFDLLGVTIDSEWRSDLKWARLAPHLSSLGGRFVLDVGCGNGYYLWRMAGAGARAAIGVDPSQKFLFQFRAVQRYLRTPGVFWLPLRSEDLPADMAAFDTVFSMGVLYHRRSPFRHLEELRAALRPGGELVLETLVVDGSPDTVLVPRGRYAGMRNVWFLPSPPALSNWLKRAGFDDVRIVDVTATTAEEQRATPWMRFHSLSDFLDPDDLTRTIEGHPAPLRAIAIARRAG